jgi:biotin operon repressor
MYDLYGDDYLPVEECAQRLGISTQRVRELVEARVLKAVWDGYTLVQPALVRGVTTAVGT